MKNSFEYQCSFKDAILWLSFLVILRLEMWPVCFAYNLSLYAVYFVSQINCRFEGAKFYSLENSFWISVECCFCLSLTIIFFNINEVFKRNHFIWPFLFWENLETIYKVNWIKATLNNLRTNWLNDKLLVSDRKFNSNSV